MCPPASLEELPWGLGPLWSLPCPPCRCPEERARVRLEPVCVATGPQEKRWPGSLAPAWEGEKLHDNTCLPSTSQLAAHFLSFPFPAAPSFLGDQRNWGIGVGWSQEPRRPASQPWALPLSPQGRRRKWVRVGVLLLGFVLPGTLCASQTWVAIPFPC